MVSFHAADNSCAGQHNFVLVTESRWVVIETHASMLVSDLSGTVSNGDSNTNQGCKYGPRSTHHSNSVCKRRDSNVLKFEITNRAAKSCFAAMNPVAIFRIGSGVIADMMSAPKWRLCERADTTL